MNLFLDHIFIITQPGAPEAERLSEIGLVEGSSNVHPGQGTSNRRFFLYGFTIELLYVSDEEEATTGSGRGLGILSRWRDIEASPFGIVVRVSDKETSPAFPGWRYTPDYFDGKMSFHVGKNSDLLHEPLCICMPPSLPAPAPVPTEYANPDWQLTSLEIDMPTEKPSEALKHFAAIDGIHLHFGKPHKMTMKFNNSATGSIENFFPELPLIIEW